MAENRKRIFISRPETDSENIAHKAGVDKNIRMVIFGHTNPDDMDSRYDIVDESDLLTAVDQIEVFLQNSHYRSHYDARKALENREPK